MTSQKHLFELPDDIHYLNGAYMSPLMKSVQLAGVEGIKRKANPSSFLTNEFFDPAEQLKTKFGKLVNCSPAQVAIIPSASYGMASAVNNIVVEAGTHAIVVSQEFPSDYYAIAGWCKDHQKELRVIEAPVLSTGRGAEWTQCILNAINEDTAVVTMSSVHWADGTRFDLNAIGEKCRASNAVFVVDGTQSVGAFPIDVDDYKIDALVTAGYKWLMGPYSIGLAYYGERFNAGKPIEESWMNRSNARDFTQLTKYTNDYQPGAARYNVGQFSNPILLPMLDKALEQVLAWGTAFIQTYTGQLIQPLLDFLNNNGYRIEENQWRTNHLFGFLLPPGLDKAKLLSDLQRAKVFVSVRGEGIRVSPHVYNTEEDIMAVIQVLQSQH